jgi:hypothetical protein
MIQKVFPVGDSAIAETGQGLILNVFFSAIVGQVGATFRKPSSVQQLLPDFVSYCQRTLPPEAFAQLRKQKLFAAGFRGHAPSVCYFNEEQPGGPFGCIDGHGYVESATTIFNRQAGRLLSLSAQEVNTCATAAIRHYASESDRWKTIGGPIEALLVTISGCHWLTKPPPPQRWSYVQDLIKDYRAGMVTLNAIPPATERELDELLGTAKAIR